MGKRVYGNLCNRFEEGKNYNKDKLIHEGDDITMYYYSDRHCFYVTRVIDQKHIFVKEYEVVADKEKAGGMGHQDWLYFKTKKECNKYLNDWYDAHPEDKWDTYERSEENPKENPEEEWVYRYGKWVEVTRFTKKSIEESELKPWLMFNDKELKKLETNGEVCRYSHLEPISFGTRSYYYDWTF